MKCGLLAKGMRIVFSNPRNCRGTGLVSCRGNRCYLDAGIASLLCLFWSLLLDGIVAHLGVRR